MQISRLATARIKIYQIPHVIFGTKGQYFFKLCITLQSNETELFCTFSSKYLYALEKWIQSECRFSDFQVLAWKLTKLLMSFFKPQVSFRLNFPTSFSVMIHNSSKIFLLKECMLWTKRDYQCTIFRLLGALMEVHPIPHAIFETTRSRFIQILHHCSVSWKITPQYFLAQT